jgi:DNA helicase-2/ATP-dependent DNA helicase PcrA
MRVFNNISIDEANVLSEFNAGVKNIKGKYLKENIDKYNSIVISKLLIKNAIPYNAIITLTIKLFKEQIGILEFYRNYYTSIYRSRTQFTFTCTKYIQFTTYFIGEELSFCIQ